MSTRALKVLTWLFVSAVLALQGFAPVAARELMLSHMGTAQGLPDDTVLDIFQDSSGLIWIATDDGLVRYDGSKVVTYLHVRGNSHTLGSDYVWQIAEGPRHNLWLATEGGGLSEWVRKTNSFINFQHAKGNKSSIQSNSIRTVVVGKSGNVAVGTEAKGISILDFKTHKFVRFEHNAGNKNSLSSNSVYALMFDNQGNLWIGTGKGLDELPKNAHKIVRFTNISRFNWNLKNQTVISLLQGSNGDIWAGTLRGGLAHLDSAGRLISVFVHRAHDKSSIPGGMISALLITHSHKMWVGTTSGLSLWNPKRNSFITYKSYSNNRKTLEGSHVRCLFQDKDGIIWIGTEVNGLFKWDPKSWDFGLHRPGWLKHKIVTAFAQTATRYLWVGTAQGLYRYNIQTHAARSFSAVTGSALLAKDEPIMSLLADNDGLWIGTFGQGLLHLKKSGKVVQLKKRINSSLGLSASGVLSMLKVGKNSLWLGLYHGGLNILNIRNNTVIQVPYAEKATGALGSSTISALAKATNGDIWAGTFTGGLELLNKKGRVVHVYKNVKGDVTSLPSNAIAVINRDTNGKLWVGSSAGLSLVEGSATSPKTVTFKTFSQNNGLPSNEILGVLPSQKNTLWVSSSNGLLRFDTSSEKIRTFHVENGLSTESFQFGAFLKLKNGELVFGGDSGFNLFNPKNITQTKTIPRIIFSQLRVLGAKDSLVPAPWETRKLLLGYKDNIVTLGFGVLDFTAPRHNRLAYRISGLTHKWISLGAQDKVTLTNLQSGRHVLEVRGENSNSVWSKPLKIVLYKSPPPWRSDAAYVFYALLALAAFGYYFRRQKAIQERQAQEKARLEAQVQERTRELKQANEELIQVAKVKSDFLDRMSHELRTPINGVVGMTELLGRTKLQTEQLRLVKTIRSSGEVLLQLVNDLLDFSKVKAGKIKLEAVPFSLKHLIEDCAGLFLPMAEEKGITLTAKVADNAASMLKGKALVGDPLRVRQILLNLISNAVKFTDRGAIDVLANVAMEGADRATVDISIKDSGIGMDSSTLERIFDPFTQAEESTSRRFGGSGLGLAICRELAQLMGGKITVTSAPGAGSTFKVSVSLAVAEAAAKESVQRNEEAQALDARVLIVEDEAVNAAVAEGYLQLLGCTSVWAETGEQALKRAREESFDVILMDINMPGEDGFAVTRKLREFDANTPIIALTAHEEGLVQDRCLAAGMNDVLSKPYTLEGCADAIKKWAIRRSMPEAISNKMTQNLACEPKSQSGSSRYDKAELEALCTLDEASVVELRKKRPGQAYALYHKLSALYQQSTHKSMTELGEALEAGDLSTAAGICHKFKSSTASLGGLAFAQELKALEALCLEGNSPLAKELYLKLKAAYQTLIEAVVRLDEKDLS